MIGDRNGRGKPRPYAQPFVGTSLASSAGWILIVFVFSFLFVTPVFAHSNFVQSEPSAGAVMETSPERIRLWFTEPLEPNFSFVYLRNAQGERLDLAPGQVDTVNPRLMTLRLNAPLDNGLYTVVWRVLSATDTHPTTGSYTFTVGDAAAALQIPALPPETVPADGAFARWMNLLSLSLLVGSIGFYLLVWTGEDEAVTRRLQLLMWVGWGAVGLTSLLLIVVQASVATDSPLFTNLNVDVIRQLVVGTRFGQIWLLRIGFWVVVWVALLLRFEWGALLVSIGILVTNSLLSHAAGAYDELPAVVSDALHLIATAAWVGGLIAFLAVIPLARTHAGRLTAAFSNFARAAVITLMLTGFYAAWLQVGSVEALTTTLYGQALLVKLVLIAPLLALAAVNLLVTQRQLNAGNTIWTRRLRGLVAAEVLLTVIVLGLVGVMTSVSPSRNTLSARANLPVPPAPNPVLITQAQDDLTMVLEISPGWIGENTFALRLNDQDGTPVEDASLIRLRFENRQRRISESELRPTHQGEGIYTVSGANLSVPGEWRIRVNVQRPDAFDVVSDFTPAIAPVPAPQRQIPVADNSAVLPGRSAILTGLGLMTFLIAGILLFADRAAQVQWSQLIAVGLMFLGGVLVASPRLTPDSGGSVDTMGNLPPLPTDLAVQNLWTLPATEGYYVYFKLFNPTAQDETLVEVRAEGANGVMLHDTVDGLMQPLDRITVPANESFHFAPGATHVMVPAKGGVTLVLVFESGRELRVALSG